MISTEWLARASALIPREDRRVLLSPARLVSRFARFAIRRATGASAPAPANDLEARDPALIELLCDLWRELGALYFRARVEGVEQVPERGPVLLVGNHNGALLPSDSFFTALAIHDRQGRERRMYSLAHDVLFDDPLLRRYAGRLGILRAGHDGGRAALGAGHCVLVYPGSDLDAFRPYRERAKVVLGGRRGFLRLALATGAPIVPVVSVGTHEQPIVLSRGDRLAKLVGAHRWARTDVMPLVWSLPWGITSGFLPYIPLPAQTTLRFGAPIRWPTLGPAAAEDPVALSRCYDEVEAAMQSMLTEMSAGRRFLLGAR
jgi:1-acyl-sn-glycerol-3-phosphate acyltransferase